ncbi:hypothetical protein BDF21DRAFT_354239 [Thamnidium elegans]|nr:hypothetical protein BDF21DRAFT_354239 [Thamnidium elegans]
MENTVDTRPWLLRLPYDIITNVSQYLDLCSNTHLMDTCQQMRYFYLSSKYLWKRIVFDVNLYNDLHPIYSSLRKLDDINGLRHHVTEVIMDDNDDPDFSPIIMLIKFPNLRKLSATNRKENTNLEVDIKLLQEMLKFDSVKPKSLPIEKISIYHYYMDYEPHLEAYQKTWNKLSIHPHVELDIKLCAYLPEDQRENQLEKELSLLEQRIQRIQVQQDNGRPRKNDSNENNDLYQNIDKCRRIMSVTAQCWSCGHHFDHCWKCVPVCEGCKIKRIPPMANDNQIRLKNRRRILPKNQLVADEDDFSVFG